MIGFVNSRARQCFQCAPTLVVSPPLWTVTPISGFVHRARSNEKGGHEGRPTVSSSHPTKAAPKHYGNSLVEATYELSTGRVQDH
jgi:hypothetical protein